MRLFEFLELAFDADAGGHCEAADPIGNIRRLHRDKICEAKVRPAGWLVGLLAQEVEPLRLRDALNGIARSGRR